jgi:RIO kinase 1
VASRPTRRRRFDDELEPDHDRDHHPGDDPRSLNDLDAAASPGGNADDVDPDEPRWSTYRDATKGPSPVPSWVVTDPRAVDVDRGVMKTGKEADVSLLERSTDSEHCLLAVKRYRSSQHRMFHRDAGYLEGRRVKESRELRAIETRTRYGREVIAAQWAVAEFAVLGDLWRRGAPVPYPVQLIGTELMMEFIGDPDGTAAPRLAQLRPDPTLARHLYHQLRDGVILMADAGYAHGDLSPYNVVVDGERLVLIDLPQAVDLVGNPQGFEFLRRDCENIAGWFARMGVNAADPAELYDTAIRVVPGLG